MLSNGFLLSATLRKPAHCSNALGPSLGTFFSSLLEENAPFSSLYFTMLLHTVALRPATLESNAGEAVFRSAPTELTQFSTTPSSVSASLFCGISC